MTIGKKLYTGLAAMLLITLMMGVIAMRNVSRLGSDVEGIANISARNLYLAGEVSTLTSDVLASVRGTLLRAHMNDSEQARKYSVLAGQDIVQIRKANGELLQRTIRPELREIAQTRIEDRIDTLEQLNTTLLELTLKTNLADADALYRERLNPLSKGVSSAAAELADKEYEQITSRADAATALVAPARNISLLMVILSLGVGLGVVWVVRGISTILQESVSELRDGADQVTNAASQVSSSSQSLAQGASEQAASLEETSASSEEINSMARKNADNSRATAELLSQSQQKVSQANRHLQEMVVSMSQITESSGKISKIIKVIDEIAFQTNILALNAAVEAARAGEAGMGFAVVADEVRSLAQRSAQAAKDTAALIEDSIARSSEGKVKVDQVALAIQAVTEDAGRVKIMVDEVSLGSEEQSRGIDQIGRAISQMEQVTQTTAANAEESAAAAEELNAQSEALKDVVERLQSMVGSAGTDSLQRVSLVRPRRQSVRPPSTLPGLSGAARVSRPAMPAHGRAVPGDGGAGKRTSTSAEEFPLEESFQSF